MQFNNNKMEEEIKFKHIMPIQLRFSDVDQLGHVNNSVYFSLYDLAKNAYFQEVMKDKVKWSNGGVVIANIQANFLSSIYLHEKIAIQTATAHIGNKSFTLVQRAVNTQTHEVKCICQTVMVGYDVESKQSCPIPDDCRSALEAYEGRPL